MKRLLEPTPGEGGWSKSVGSSAGQPQSAGRIFILFFSRRMPTSRTFFAEDLYDSSRVIYNCRFFWKVSLPWKE